MLRKFTIRRGDNYVALVWAERVEIPSDTHGSFYFWTGDHIVCGAGSHDIQVRVFEGDLDVPILPKSLIPIVPITPFMDDFTQADTFRVEEAA